MDTQYHLPFLFISTNNQSPDFIAWYTDTPNDTPTAKPSHTAADAAAAKNGNIVLPPIIKS